MNINSSNSVILQQKIIHLQSELAKYKSIQKERLISENQKLHAEVELLRAENAVLKEQLGSIQVENSKDPTINQDKKKPINRNSQKKTTNSEDQIQNSWFMSNLVHESNRKNK